MHIYHCSIFLPIAGAYTCLLYTSLSARTLGVPVVSLGLSTVLALFDPPRLFAPAEVAVYVDAAAGVLAGAISAALLS